MLKLLFKKLLLFLKHTKDKHHNYLKLQNLITLCLYDLTTYFLIIINIILF
jgi:hypothetical protein